MEIKHPARSRISLCSPSERMGFPGGVHGEDPACQYRDAKRRVFDPWVGKIPWRRKWQPTPVFFPGESHGQRSLVGYSPQGHNASECDWSDLSCMQWKNAHKALSKSSWHPGSTSIIVIYHDVLLGLAAMWGYACMRRNVNRACMRGKSEFYTG